MVFILYKLYVLLPYTYPTPKLSPHRRRCISTFPPKNSLCMIYKHFKLWGQNVLINHLLLVIPMSYPCHYTNLCPHKPHKHEHTHAHTHTHTHILFTHRGFTTEKVLLLSSVIYAGQTHFHCKCIMAPLLLRKEGRWVKNESRLSWTCTEPGIFLSFFVNFPLSVSFSSVELLLD